MICSGSYIFFIVTTILYFPTIIEQSQKQTSKNEYYKHIGTPIRRKISQGGAASANIIAVDH